MIGGTLEGQNQRTLELIEHLIETGQLTLHGLLYLLHDTQSTTELAKIAELSSKRPLTIQTGLAERDVEVLNRLADYMEAGFGMPITMGCDDVREYAVKICNGGDGGE